MQSDNVTEPYLAVRGLREGRHVQRVIRAGLHADLAAGESVTLRQAAMNLRYTF
jgi:hypothetical protein